jgi:hypothetical protein
LVKFLIRQARGGESTDEQIGQSAAANRCGITLNDGADLPRKPTDHDRAKTAGDPPPSTKPDLEVVESITPDCEPAVCFMVQETKDEAQVSGEWIQMDHESVISPEI